MMNKKAKIILFSIICGFGLYGGSRGVATPGSTTVFRLAPKQLYRWAYINQTTKEAILAAIQRMKAVTKEGSKPSYPAKDRYIVFESADEKEIYIGQVTQNAEANSTWSFKKLQGDQFVDANMEEAKVLELAAGPSELPALGQLGLGGQIILDQKKQKVLDYKSQANQGLH
jgi:hypothetical protein